jgi:hypothetical protein
MATKISDGEYSLKLTGSGILIDKIVSEPIALQIVKLVMGDASAAAGAGAEGARGGASAGSAGSAAKPVDTSTPKAFMTAKLPKTDMERVTCLAYYLTHSRNTQAFKTNELTTLNTEAAGGRLSNVSATARNAVTHGYLSAAGQGRKQIASRGEALVEALPDRDKVAAALEAHPARKPRKRRKIRKTK